MLPAAPQGRPGLTRARTALVEEWPAYLAYLVSFATIGAVGGSAHTVITEYLDHATSLLDETEPAATPGHCLLAVPTKLLGEFSGNEGAERVAVTFFGIDLLL